MDRVVVIASNYQIILLSLFKKTYFNYSNIAVVIILIILDRSNTKTINYYYVFKQITGGRIGQCKSFKCVIIQWSGGHVLFLSILPSLPSLW